MRLQVVLQSLLPDGNKEGLDKRYFLLAVLVVVVYKQVLWICQAIEN